MSVISKICEFALSEMPIGLINDKSALVLVGTCFRQAKADFDPKLCRQMAWLDHNE